MIWQKLIAPDSIQGKLLMWLKGIFDIAVFVARNPSRQSFRSARNIMRMKPRFTMVTSKNLLNLCSLVRQAQRLDLPGDIVECGVWNGGSAALMGLACLEAPQSQRTIWLFDSFQGLPPPGVEDGTEAQNAYFAGLCEGNTNKVKMAFNELGVTLANVRIIPGWFDSTLNRTPVSSIAILHIDADWYDSVKLVLDTFYDRVVPGGFIVLDDYGFWQGCNQALADFVAGREIGDVEMKQVDRTGGYFQKPPQSILNRVS